MRGPRRGQFGRVAFVACFVLLLKLRLAEGAQRSFACEAWNFRGGCRVSGFQSSPSSPASSRGSAVLQSTPVCCTWLTHGGGSSPRASPRRLEASLFLSAAPADVFSRGKLLPSSKSRLLGEAVGKTGEESKQTALDDETLSEAKVSGVASASRGGSVFRKTLALTETLLNQRGVFPGVKVEDAVLKAWDVSRESLFGPLGCEATATAEEKKESCVSTRPFCVPPPNLTGALHVGHALCLAAQDAFFRKRAMDSQMPTADSSPAERFLCMAGVDHAGLGLQTLFLKHFRQRRRRGLPAPSACTLRPSLPRAFLRRHFNQLFETETRGDAAAYEPPTWTTEECAGCSCGSRVQDGEILRLLERWIRLCRLGVVQQQRRLGAGLWQKRPFFTLDPSSVQTARKVFVHLHQRGLIERRLLPIEVHCHSHHAVPEEQLAESETSPVGACPPLLVALPLHSDSSPCCEKDSALQALLVAIPTLRHLFAAAAVVVQDPGVYAQVGDRLACLPLVNRRVPVLLQPSDDSQHPHTKAVEKFLRQRSDSLPKTEGCGKTLRQSAPARIAMSWDATGSRGRASFSLPECVRKALELLSESSPSAESGEHSPLQTAAENDADARGQEPSVPPETPSQQRGKDSSREKKAAPSGAAAKELLLLSGVCREEGFACWRAEGESLRELGCLVTGLSTETVVKWQWVLRLDRLRPSSGGLLPQRETLQQEAALSSSSAETLFPCPRETQSQAPQQPFPASPEEKEESSGVAKHCAGVQVQPVRFASFLQSHLQTLRPWTLSRQSWWGVPVPAYLQKNQKPCRPLQPNSCLSQASLSVCQKLLAVASSLLKRDEGFLQRHSAPSLESCECRRFAEGGEEENEGSAFVAEDLEAARRKALEAQGGKALSAQLVPDPDVLDTWFVSALWPLTSLASLDSQMQRLTPTVGKAEGEGERKGQGGEEQRPFDGKRAGSELSKSNALLAASTAAGNSSCASAAEASDRKVFCSLREKNTSFPTKHSRPGALLPVPSCYPYESVATGHDILLFWIAKQIALCSFLTGMAPFRRVFVHPLLTDPQGLKISKTKGNAKRGQLRRWLETYGADATRLALLSCGEGFFARVGEADVARAFGDLAKLWHSVRELGSLVEVVSKCFLTGELTTAAKSLRHFVRKSLAGWYIPAAQQEIAMVVTGTPTSRGKSQQRLGESWPSSSDTNVGLAVASSWKEALFKAVETAVRLLHPMCPLVTDALSLVLSHERASKVGNGATTNSEVPSPCDGDRAPSLISKAWPSALDFGPKDAYAEALFSVIKGAVGVGRKARERHGKERLAKCEMHVFISQERMALDVAESLPLIAALTNLEAHAIQLHVQPSKLDTLTPQRKADETTVESEIPSLVALEKETFVVSLKGVKKDGILGAASQDDLAAGASLQVTVLVSSGSRADAASVAGNLNPGVYAQGATPQRRRVWERKLRDLERRLNSPGFFERAPKEVQAKLLVRRRQLENLARGSEKAG